MSRNPHGIDPNFQGRGLFYQLAKKMLEAGDRSGRAYIVGGCDESLVTIWQRVGFTTLPIWFNDGDLGSIEQQLIIKELHPAVVGCIDNSAARHRRP
ncbi:MAG: hypothetical protein DCC75_06965 [Proteobacteria bacterium]|nr:MAG: hypothetical protein DCC75_06965 [Pseudomonadota bacterium]